MENGYIESFHGKFRRNAWTNTDFSRWTMHGKPSKAGESITTRCAHTVRWAAWRRKNLQQAIKMWKAQNAPTLTQPRRLLRN